MAYNRYLLIFRENLSMEPMVYLNGQFLPKEQATISPMDRGFLFGDGIYEVIPCNNGLAIALERHLDRLERNLSRIKLNQAIGHTDWRAVIDTLLSQSNLASFGIYLQITRGVAERRHHTYTKDLVPTEFAYVFSTPPPPDALKPPAQTMRLKSQLDLRWQQCDIKVTALLGNVMHYQQAIDEGFDEALLYTQTHRITEAAASNVFCVIDGTIQTPTLDERLLPGVTRSLLIDILRDYSHLPVIECDLTLADALNADEVWLTSSTREIAPVGQIDEHRIGSGDVGSVWRHAVDLFQTHKFDYP